MESLRARAASGLVGVAAAVAILALVIPLFLNPVWVAFEQGRSQATAWTAIVAVLAHRRVGGASVEAGAKRAGRRMSARVARVNAQVAI